MFYASNENKQAFYDRCRGWEVKFAFLPKQCFRSGKKIWLKYGYRGIALWTGPGDSIPETQWHDKDEHLLWLLKK